MPSHIRAALTATTLSIPVARGVPVLGTWQSLLLVEMDGPRSRTLDLTLIGS